MTKHPLQPGDKVRVKKGALIAGSQMGEKFAGKAFTVEIETYIPGLTFRDSTVSWLGSAGYTCVTKATNVLKLVEVAADDT